jgi:ABC-type polysaccharide/polyol phosphate transport system ATPase subunit
MAVIDLQHVDLKYPLRIHQGITLKEFFIKHLLRKPTAPLIREVHALRDVSLRIEEGERVGIIGCNGAGKTTLLRTMAGIYPIAGGVRNVEGSICSLLDITVGFEIDANGWDNIRYRGYLQGETPQTLKPKFQEIADFTELGQFMNIPVRCYSVGMAFRLAFAIATSSMPEILFVDEVFDASDLAFRRKAEDRMQLFMNRAKIVVMVGHNLTFFEEFAQRVIWLDRGQVRMDGEPGEVIEAFREEAESQRLAA